MKRRRAERPLPPLADVEIVIVCRLGGERALGTRRELDLFDDKAELEAAANTLVPVDLYPQREMADEILALLAGGSASLERFRDGDPGRLVAALLALLELVRSRLGSARQARLHEEILLERVRV